MAERITAGLFLTERDCALLDPVLRWAVADLGRRNGAAPAGLVLIAEEVRRVARQFQDKVLVEADSGTGADPAGSVTRVSPVSERRLSAQEAARLAGVSREMICRLAAKGTLRGVRAGRRGAWVLDPQSLAVWMADRTGRAA